VIQGGDFAGRRPGLLVEDGKLQRLDRLDVAGLGRGVNRLAGFVVRLVDEILG